MSRTAYKFSATIGALLLTVMLAACGSDKKEGNATPESVPRVASEGTCRVCHAATIDPVSQRPLLADFLTASGSHNQEGRVDGPNADLGCQGCHGGGAQHNGVGPIPFPDPLASNRCITCHTANGLDPTTRNLTALFALAKDGQNGFVGQCARCHTSRDDGQPSDFLTGNLAARGVHGANLTDQNCVNCHSVVQNGPEHGAALVNDNSGVRAVTLEFNKWSHHVTGVTLNSAHCAACHLEGTVEDGAIIVDRTKHMSDAQVHLRNADDDSEFLWNPAAPNHSNMDNFCMSCHDSNGATSPMSVQIQAIINANGLTAAGKTASASNPFGDTISNRYDKMQRPAVVDASSQFNTTNNSHHAVKGPRYSGNSRFSGVNPVDGNVRRTIASAATFAQNSSPLLQGPRSTIYDAGNFNQIYTPLENTGGEAAPRTGAKNLGDDSTLHCGDCHTVGQWKPGSSEIANGPLAGTPTTAAIGAHGSNNEYLLRNSIGTDQRHTQNAFTNTAGVVTYNNPNGAFLVCYNCHSYNRYGSIFLQTGVVGGHVGEYDAQGRCNGIGNTLPFNGYTTGTATDGTQFASRFEGPVARYAATPAFAPGFPLVGTAPVGEQNPDFGNIFGIQCQNCHNSGAGNAYGGIHGSAKNTNWQVGSVLVQPNTGVTGGAYLDGMGNTNKVQRFLPGLGNGAHVPGTLGGFTGGSVVPVNTAAGTPAYTYITGGVSNDTNWEQKAWNQSGNLAALSVIPTSGAISNAVIAGAGCYTLGEGAPALPSTVHQGGNAIANLVVAPSVTGAGGPSTSLFGTWGACDDHDAGQGRGDHGFIKKIVRPVTY